MRLHRSSSTLSALILSAFMALPAARAADIAVYGEIDPAPLTALGHSVTVLTLSQLEKLDLGGYDVLLLGHIVAPDGWSSAACTSVESFLDGGGGVIAEWNGAFVLFSATGGAAWMPLAPQCALFAGTVDDGDVVAFATPIAITDPSSPLVEGLADGFDMGDGSESFVSILGRDPDLWLVPASFTGASGTAPAVMTARYGSGGRVVVAAMDLFDAFGWGGAREADAQTLLQNMITVAQWPRCQPDGVEPVDAADLAVEIRALTDPAFTPPGPADCIPDGGLGVPDLEDLLVTLFGP